MKMLLMKLLSFDKTNWFIKIFLNNLSEQRECNVWWSCKQTCYVDMANEETVENEETGED